MDERRSVALDRRRQQRDLAASERLFHMLAENAHDIVYRYRLRPTPGFEYVSPAATVITGYTPEEHYADPLLGIRLVHPDDRHVIEEMQAGGIPGEPVVLRWVRKDGTVVWTEQQNVAVLDDDGVVVAVDGIARDVSARVRARDRLEAVLQISRDTLEQRPVDDVLRTVASRARELAVATTAMVTVPLTDRSVHVRIADGRGAAAVQGREFPSAGSVAAEAMQSGAVVRLRDVAAERGLHPVAELGEIGPVLAVPLSTANSVFGTLVLVRLRGRPAFSDDDVAVVTMFAQQASIVLEHARLREEIDRLALVRDRDRIARSLHERVVASLFSVGVSLQAAERLGDGAGGRARIEEAIAGVDRAIRDLRGSIYDLRPDGGGDGAAPGSPPAR